jgi:predicted MPP superfamily phosphohydrolase
MEGVEGPAIALWHEPDLVWMLPKGCSLQLSGHYHGGQFKIPPGYPPMTTRNGQIYIDGFYPEAETPIFVTRGVGTTFLPSRFQCPPEVAVLTLVPSDR